MVHGNFLYIFAASCESIVISKYFFKKIGKPGSNGRGKYV